MATVSSIDFGRFCSNVLGERQRVVSEIDEALKSIGFLGLYGHGIDQGKINAGFQWSQRLFALSDLQKTALPTAGQYRRGFSGLGKEKVRDLIPMNENFACGNPEDEEPWNTWPPEELLPGFRAFMEDFYKDCAKLTHQLLDCLSLALDLSPEDSLGQHHAQSLFNMSLIHYPAILAKAAHLTGLARSPAHSDFGTLTLLFQDDVGGLEIADPASTSNVTTVAIEKAGRFTHVDPKPGTIVVNVGYLLMRWSNGRWKNTVHRVSLPPRLKEEITEGYGSRKENIHEPVFIPERYSIACFASPNPDTTVEAFPHCYRDKTPKWKPISAGEFLRRKRAAIFT